MQANNSFVLPSDQRKLVEFLREHKLENAVEWMLESLGPLSVLLAQFVHAGSALLRPVLTTGQVDALTQILEDPREMDTFKVHLREDASHGE